MKSRILASNLSLFWIYSLGAAVQGADEPLPSFALPAEAARRFTDGIRQLGGLLPVAQAAPQTPAAQPGAVIDFEEGSPLGRVLRMLANQAGINYLEPQFDPAETVAISLRGVSAREAFQRIAESRGYKLQDRNGVVELVRGEKQRETGSLTRAYVLRHVDARLALPSIANLLGIRDVKPPAKSSSAFPEPASTGSTSFSQGGGSDSSGSSSSAGGGSSMLPKDGRFVPGLPMDTPLWTGGHNAAEQNSVYLDRITNALVVRANEKQHEEVARYMAKIDLSEPQIEITARVIEIDAGKMRDLGLDWAVGYTNKSGRLGGTASVKNGALTSTLKKTGALSGTQAILEGWQVEVLLRASEGSARSSLVTDARVVTRSGIPAVVNNMVEERIEIFTSSGNSFQNANTGVSSVPAGSVQSGTQIFQTGVVLDVLPRVLEDGRIDLNINPTVLTRIGETTGASGQKLPIIVRRSTTTSVMVRDGFTVGIGGLMQMDDSRTRNQVPIVGKIPLVGALFRSSGEQRKKSNLVILVTPRILKDDSFMGAPTLPEARNAAEQASAELLNPTPWISEKGK
ncbi:MAG: Type II secretory pathway component GspD/PulD (secretin) [Verrucomicrobia bacterium]|nr:MAG: Type II secretory pathway component GspD/PulD (secretin) [Verrucomicrobiota bacterium]